MEEKDLLQSSNDTNHDLTHNIVDYINCFVGVIANRFNLLMAQAAVEE